ncbi:MAG TPA: hypothetical protein EYP10_13670, partial [Armatimonadetes bacterium]|nr:hypothetical protein [Armatimonadota bacterium]
MPMFKSNLQTRPIHRRDVSPMEICERVTNISSDDLRKVLRMEIFPRVQKAGRYIGGEVNSIVKHPERIWLRFALAFPDVYEVGMCSAGMSIIYETVNRLDGVQAERVFAPWFDMEAQLRKRKLPLYGLESFTPLHQFDVVGFSLPYELL